MKKRILLLAVCLFPAGCEEVGFIEKAKYDVLQQHFKEAQDEWGFR